MPSVWSIVYDFPQKPDLGSRYVVDMTLFLPHRQADMSTAQLKYFLHSQVEHVGETALGVSK